MIYKAFMLIVVLLCGSAFAQDRSWQFDSDKSMTDWEITGNVTIDPEQNHSGSGGAMRIDPGGKAVMKLRDHDASGKISMWVYDDGTVAAPPTQRRVGPHWGILTQKGRILAVGSIYAPYLKGDTTYTSTEYIPAGTGAPFTKLTYLAVNRAKGWHEWVFDFDADKGFKISLDGKPVDRFDWNKSDALGFAGIVVIGDTAGGKAQTVWVDDVTGVLGGDMKAKPTAPPRHHRSFRQRIPRSKVPPHRW